MPSVFSVDSLIEAVMMDDIMLVSLVAVRDYGIDYDPNLFDAYQKLFRTAKDLGAIRMELHSAACEGDKLTAIFKNHGIDIVVRTRFDGIDFNE